jgi:hypothetical protein
MQRKMRRHKKMKGFVFLGHQFWFILKQEGGIVEKTAKFTSTLKIKT